MTDPISARAKRVIEAAGKAKLDPEYIGHFDTAAEIHAEDIAAALVEAVEVMRELTAAMGIQRALNPDHSGLSILTQHRERKARAWLEKWEKDA